MTSSRLIRAARLLAAMFLIGQLLFTSSAAAHAYTPAVLRACRSRHAGIELTLSEDNAAAHLRSLTIGHEVIVPVTEAEV